MTIRGVNNNSGIRNNLTVTERNTLFSASLDISPANHNKEYSAVKHGSDTKSKKEKFVI